MHFLIVRLDGQFVDQLKGMREGDAACVTVRMSQKTVVVAATAAETRELPR